MKWWQRFLRRKQLEEQLKRELQFHIEESVSSLRADGLADAEARRKVRHDFGGPEQIKEECRDARGTVWLESTIQDFKYTGRILRKTPAFTVAAVVTIALSTGANTAIFQLLDAVRLRTLPVVQPQQLAHIQIRHGNDGFGISDGPFDLTYPLFEQIRAHQQTFSGVFAWQLDTARIGQGAAGRSAAVLLISGDFFSTLQLPPAAGRLFRPADDLPGCPSPGVVISHSFWEKEFAGQRSAIGSELIVEDHHLRIVGVTPRGFSGPDVGRRFDIALPLCSLALSNRNEKPLSLQRDQFSFNVMGRLKPAVTLAQASEQLQAISPALMQATEPSGYSSSSLNTYLRFRLEAVPGANGVSQLRSQYDNALWLLLAITGLILLIACANLSNLMLARASTRDRELAVRVAVGASRSRLIRQALCESLLLSFLGAALGLVIAKALSLAIVRYLSTEGNPLHLDLRLDWRMVAFTITLATVVCTLLGIIPALRSARTQPAAAMKAGGRSVTTDRARFRFQRLLVVVQVSISLVLVTAALLFVGSFRSLATLDPGFKETGILAASFDLSRLKLGASAILPYQRQLAAEIRSTPQVEAVVSTSNFLIGGGMWTLGIHSNALHGSSRFTWVSPGFFPALGTPILAGRDFNTLDTARSPKVSIVNRTFVRQFFPGVNPVGRTFRTEAEPGYPATEYQIVGVIKDTRYFDLREPPPPISYAPAAQLFEPRPYANLYIRSTAPLAAVESAVRRRVGAWHADVGMEFHTFQQQIADGLVRERLLAVLSGFFGALALLLATIGLYGVLAYNAERRRNEIGIRMALGATRARIMRIVISEAALVVVVGLAIGLAGSLILAHVIASLLFGISTRDPLRFAEATLVLAAAACVGSLLPALRASRLDPVVTLREN